MAQSNKSRAMWVRKELYPSWFHARGWITGLGVAGLIAAGVLVLSPVFIEPEVEHEAQVRLASLGFELQGARAEGQDLDLWVADGPGAPAQVEQGARAAAQTTRCDVFGLRLPCAEQVRVHLTPELAARAGASASPPVEGSPCHPAPAEGADALAQHGGVGKEKVQPPSPTAQEPSAKVAPDSVHARCEGELAALMKDGSIRFGTASTRIVKSSYKLVEKLAKTASACPGYILVVGHTDNVGKPESNAWLSRVRAKAVRRALMSRGLPEQKVFALGKGAQEPIASNDTPSGRAKNRRIEFRVVPTAPPAQESPGQ